jgi:flagellar export protein FliJ
MPFRFSLEAVLHFRRSIEHQHELRLRLAHQQVAHMRHLIAQFDAAIVALQQRQAQQLAAGMTAAEWTFQRSQIDRLRESRQNAERELARLETLRNHQQKVFQQARRERETFESLRTSHLREYERDAARREQRQLDELFLLRQAHLRRG